jgi:murein DD-endopeptidase MepM/ murein hydrolase activator NlpD
MAEKTTGSTALSNALVDQNNVTTVHDVMTAPRAPSLLYSRVGDELELVEVKEATVAAIEVFNRVKSEKMTSEMPPVTADGIAYSGVAKEIVDKAIKQKERERANRASAAASRNKVMRYQTELESRLNRVEAERNAYRKQCSELKTQIGALQNSKDAVQSDLTVAHAFLAKLRNENPDLVGYCKAFTPP